MTIAKILSLSYCLVDRTMTIGLSNHAQLVHVRIDNIKHGGKNCEINTLKVGGKIAYESIGKMNILTECTIISDGIREVDIEGNLIRW